MSFSAPRPPATSPPRPPSSLSRRAGARCEIPEQWLGDDDDGLDNSKHSDGAAASRSAGNNDQSGEPPAPAAKRRGRKTGSRADGPVISHVVAERQRRDKLNRRFCDLRAAVPTVSRMDKASLLADATSYIAELRGRVEKLEAEAEANRQAAVSEGAARNAAPTAAPVTAVASPWFGLEEKLEVRMVGREAAALRLTSPARHAPARLMDALRLLDLPVHHASVCRAGGVTVLDAVVDVPAGPLQDEAWLRAALLHRLQGSAPRSFFSNQLISYCKSMTAAGVGPASTIASSGEIKLAAYTVW